MSDLVKRLRQHGCPIPQEPWSLAINCGAAGRCGCDEADAVEAATEIEKLRDEVGLWKDRYEAERQAQVTVEVRTPTCTRVSGSGLKNRFRLLAEAHRALPAPKRAVNSASANDILQSEPRGDRTHDPRLKRPGQLAARGGKDSQAVATARHSRDDDSTRHHDLGS